jgi:hypothetical protein
MTNRLPLDGKTIADTAAAVRTYVGERTQEIINPSPSGSNSAVSGHVDAAAAVFHVLTRRRFTYLSSGRACTYRRAILDDIGNCLAQGQYVEFCLDIGPGYHASLDPDTQPLNYAIGLGELLLLNQIHAFLEQIRFLPVGVRFTLVIDDLCGHFVNAACPQGTAGYCHSLRRLITWFGLDDRIDVVAESDRLEPARFHDWCRAACTHTAVPPLPDAHQHANMERFRGRRLSNHDAVTTLHRYQAAIMVSERCLDRHLNGIRMTQRATPKTFAFRAFPGCDSRIQCGEVCLREMPEGRLLPWLWTSTRFHDHAVHSIDVTDLGLPGIDQVRTVEPLEMRSHAHV